MIAGRYSFERTIGRGGTSTVWLGRDELLGRPVALKKIGLLPGADHTDVDRAEREARLSARLQHPHVVAVFDVVDDPDSEDHWLVMEYVDGVTLADLVRDQGRLTPEAAAPLLWQVADGLVAAHAAGITHRDVKPSNILVRRDGRAQITDFGIARVATDAALTQTGLMTGSPAYLAPEVASGGRGGPAADVWALGATAFHALAGRPPYEVGDHVLAAMFRIVNDDPPRLADAGSLAPLLAGTMVKDPEQRWSMAQVRDFLPRPDRSAAPVRTVAASTPPRESGTDGTRVLGDAAGPTPVTTPVTTPGPPLAAPVGAARAAVRAPLSWRPSRGQAFAGVAAVLVVLVVLAVVLAGRGPEGTHSPAASGSPSTTAAAGPTARGMESFIRDYVRTVADDPARAWPMLTPKFQRESGGLDHYRDFWDPATDGRVLSINADPASLSVSYQVHFDNWDNGPGPTVLDLVFSDGDYRIDGERTKGFSPAD